MSGSQQGEWPPFAGYQVPNMSGNQQGDLPQFDVNQGPMISGAQPGESPKFGDDEMPTGSMYGSQQGELPQFDPNELPGIYENQHGELEQFDVNQAPMLFGDQQVMLEQFDANQMPTESMYGSQQGESPLSPANQVPMMFGNQQGESSLSPANQVPTMSSNQQGESQQFNANQALILFSNQQGELSLSPTNQVPTMSSNQQGESQQFNANQALIMFSNQQGELPQFNANQRPMMFGSQQGESSLSPANQAPLGATSAQGGQGAEQSASIESVMAALTHLAAVCEGIETTLPMDVYRELQRDYNALVSAVQAKIYLPREPVPQPILEASIRIESRLFQLMHHTPVDDVASPVLGRRAAPPCQIESMNSVAMAQTVATLNQAFPMPCRSCAGTGTACQRSFIDEECAFCEGSNRECKTDYTVDTGPPPVSGGSAGAAANTRRVMDNLFQEHCKAIFDIVHSRVRDATSLLYVQNQLSSLRPTLEGHDDVFLWNVWIGSMKERWLHCNMEIRVAKNPPACLETSRGWAVRECVQGRLSRMKLMARDTPDTFSVRFGAFGLFRDSIARNLFWLDTYWLAEICPEQRLEIRNTLVDLLSFCNITAGYICSAQSYLALAHREFLRANCYMVAQGFVETWKALEPFYEQNVYIDIVMHLCRFAGPEIPYQQQQQQQFNMKHKALASLWRFASELMTKQLEQRKKLEMFCETMVASKTGDFGVTTMTRDAKAKVLNERWGELKKRLDVYTMKWIKRNEWMLVTIRALGIMDLIPPPLSGTVSDSTTTAVVPSGSVPPSEMFPDSMPGPSS